MLIKCPECGKEISDKAPSCIHCGYPIGAGNDDKSTNNKATNSIESNEGKAEKSENKKEWLLEDGEIWLPQKNNLNEIMAFQKLIDDDPEYRELVFKKYPLRKNAWEQEHGKSSAPKPKCPTCGSNDLHFISSSERVCNIIAFGLLGNKRRMQFKCKNCGYMW